MKVITFSRTYPSYHPKAGQPTYFVEKVWSAFDKLGLPKLNSISEDLVPDSILSRLEDFQPKYHTIRAGHRWKAGDWFSPRVWSGKPYASKQIQFAPDIQIKKVWRFNTDGCDFFINDRLVAYSSSPNELFLTELATNDGLSEDDLLAWFQYPTEFDGQIICWNESINY
jgi:hypothetical protein